MTEFHSELKKDYICHCSCTTKAQIETLFNNGADTLEEISGRTGAAAGCGACEVWILDFLAEIRKMKAAEWI